MTQELMKSSIFSNGFTFQSFQTLQRDDFEGLYFNIYTNTDQTWHLTILYLRCKVRICRECCKTKQSVTEVYKEDACAGWITSIIGQELTNSTEILLHLEANWKAHVKNKFLLNAGQKTD